MMLCYSILKPLFHVSTFHFNVLTLRVICSAPPSLLFISFIFNLLQIALSFFCFYASDMFNDFFITLILVSFRSFVFSINFTTLLFSQTFYYSVFTQIEQHIFLSFSTALNFFKAHLFLFLALQHFTLLVYFSHAV